MASHVVIGIHLMSDSVSAAFKLHQNTAEPQPITWDKAGKQREAPVWINYKPGDETSYIYPWSPTRPNNAAFDRAFLYRYHSLGASMPPDTFSSFLDMFRINYGWRSFNGTSEPAGVSNANRNDERAKRFLGSLKTHILDQVKERLGDAMSQITFVINISDQMLDGTGTQETVQVYRIIEDVFSGPGATVQILTNSLPHLSWAISQQSSLIEFTPESQLASLHVGRHYSIVQKYNVLSLNETNLSLQCCPERWVLAIGTFDLASHFARTLLSKYCQAITNYKDEVCGSKVLREIEAKQEEFMISLPTFKVGRDQKYIFRPSSSSARFTLTITTQEWQDCIFNPVLNALLTELRNNISQSMTIYCSGILFENLYISQYYESWEKSQSTILRLCLSIDGGMSNAYGLANYFEQNMTTIDISDADGAQWHSNFIRPEFPNSMRPSSLLQSISTFTTDSLARKIVILHAVIQRCGCDNIVSSAVTDEVYAVIQELKKSNRISEIRDLATLFSSVYFENKAGLPRRPILERRYAAWAKKRGVRIEEMKIDQDSFWLKGAQDSSIRILRFMAFCGDTQAFRIGLEACSLAANDWICELSHPENVASMAIIVDFCDGITAIVEAGACWSDCLYWAIEWDSERIVHLIRTESGLSLEKFEERSWIPGSITPLSKATEEGQVIIAKLLCDYNAEKQPLNLNLTLYADNVEVTSDTHLDEVVGPFIQWQNDVGYLYYDDGYGLYAHRILEKPRNSSHHEWMDDEHGSGNGTLIVPMYEDGTVRLWEAQTGTLQAILRGHLGGVTSVAFSPDGRQIVSGSEDRTVRLWDAQVGTLQATLRGHLDGVSSVAFSPDGRQIISVSYYWNDGTARLWDAQAGTLQATLEGDYYTWIVATYCDSLSPDDSQIISPNGRQVISPNGRQVISPNGRQVISGSEDRTLRLWDAKSHRLQATIKGDFSGVTSVAFSPDSRQIVTGSRLQSPSMFPTRYKDNKVNVKSAETRKLQAILEGHLDWVTLTALSLDGNQIVSGSEDKTDNYKDGIVRLWDMWTRTLQTTLKGHLSGVTSVAFSSDGKQIISGSQDKTVRLWDAQAGTLQATLRHLDMVTSVAFSPDGQQIVSGSQDKTVRFRGVGAWTLQVILEEHTDRVTSIAFSPDGRQIISGSWDKTVQLWDTRTCTLQATLEGHLGRVTSVAFSPNGRQVISGSDYWKDRTVRLWEAQTGTLQATLGGHLGGVTSVNFSPDGRQIVSGSEDRTVRLWDARTPVL